MMFQMKWSENIFNHVYGWLSNLPCGNQKRPTHPKCVDTGTILSLYRGHTGDIVNPIVVM